MLFTQRKKLTAALLGGSFLTAAFFAAPYSVDRALASDKVSAFDQSGKSSIVLPRPHPQRNALNADWNAQPVEAASTFDEDVLAEVLEEITKLRETIEAERAGRERLRSDLEATRAQVRDLQKQLGEVALPAKPAKEQAVIAVTPLAEKKAEKPKVAAVEAPKTKKDPIATAIDTIEAPAKTSETVVEIKPTVEPVEEVAAVKPETASKTANSDVEAQEADSAVLAQPLETVKKADDKSVTETADKPQDASKAVGVAKEIAKAITTKAPETAEVKETEEAKPAETSATVKKAEETAKEVTETAKSEETAVTVKPKERSKSAALATESPVTTLPLQDESATDSENALAVAKVDPASLLPFPRENPRPRVLPEIPKGPLYIKLPIKNDTYDVVVLGDSLGSGLWQGMHQNFRGEVNPALKITKLAKANTGIVRNDRFDWMRRTEQAANRSGAQIAVLMFGANDAQTIREGGKRHHLKTPGWEKLYRQRIDRIITALKRKKIAVYWVGLPNVRIPSLRRNYQHFNAIFREKAAEHNIKFIDTWDVSNNSAGAYQASGRALNGRIVKLRAKDGTHFTSAGYRLLASYLDKTLRSDLQASRTAKLARSYKLRRSGG